MRGGDGHARTAETHSLICVSPYSVGSKTAAESNTSPNRAKSPIDSKESGRKEVLAGANRLTENQETGGTNYNLHQYWLTRNGKL